MKKNLKLLSILLLFLNQGVSAQSFSLTFSYTGSVQSWTVPAGVTSIDFDAKGASGGRGTYYSPGGCGGEVQGSLPVTPGQVLKIYVGGMGVDGSYYGAGIGGWNGGGTGGYSFFGPTGGGGGGATDLRIGGTALVDRMVAAGGGAGGGDDYGTENGGDGGGPAAAGDGWDYGMYDPITCGGGATSVLGGPAATSGGTSGTALFGGDGSGYFFTDGGGGGGGMYGGGGGYSGGGGGGSSYADPSATSVVHTQGGNCSSDGVLTIAGCAPPIGGAIVGPSTLCVGTTITYTDPTGSAGGTWSSSVPSVASVNPLTGVVTALTPGSTTIIYTLSFPCGSAFPSTSVTVIATSSPITGIDSVCMGGLDTLFNATPGGVWTSSVTAVATIDPVTGEITTVSAGTTTISYTLGACASTVVLTVNPLPSAIVGSSSVCRFLTTTLTDPSPGGTWSSTVPGAATVNSTSGVVTGVGIGATNVVYTLPTGCSIMHFISVSQPPLPITGPSQVCLSNAIILTELVGGGSWTSSAPLNASVTASLSNGVVTGLNPSVVTISYTMPSCPPATHVVTVNPLPAVITGPTAICVGMTTTLSDATPGGAWVSGDPAVTVTPTGDVTGSDTTVSATIYYILPTTCFVSATVYVNAPPPPIIGMVSICQGVTTTLSDLRPGGIWSSTDLAIAQVIDTTGVVNGVSAGLVNISYTLPSGCFAMIPFVVNPLLPGSVSVTSSPTGIICDSTMVTFTATPVNGGVATYVWEKFSTPVGGIDSTGTYTYMARHGDAIMVLMMPHGVCALHDTVIDTVILNIYPNNVTPIITITTSSSGPITYIGQVVTFFSSVTYGGTVQTYQWYQNGNAIPGATNSSYSTAIYAPDTFWCVVNGNPPCSVTTPAPPGISNKIVIQDFLGVGTLPNGRNDLALYPNPNNGTFTLNGKLATSSGDEVSYEVTNMLGEVLKTGSVTPQNGIINATVSMDHVAAGIYLLRVYTESGSQTFHFVIGR